MLFALNILSSTLRCAAWCAFHEILLLRPDLPTSRLHFPAPLNGIFPRITSFLCQYINVFVCACECVSQSIRTIIAARIFRTLILRNVIKKFHFNIEIFVVGRFRIAALSLLISTRNNWRLKMKFASVKFSKYGIQGNRGFLAWAFQRYNLPAREWNRFGDKKDEKIRNNDFLVFRYERTGGTRKDSDKQLSLLCKKIYICRAKSTI